MINNCIHIYAYINCIQQHSYRYSMSSVRHATLYFDLTECKNYDLGTVARLGRPLVLNIA